MVFTLLQALVTRIRIPISHRSTNAGFGTLGTNHFDPENLDYILTNFKYSNQGKAHTETQNSTAVSNEPNNWHLLVSSNFGHSGILDVNVDDSQVVSCIDKEFISQFENGTIKTKENRIE